MKFKITFLKAAVPLTKTFLMEGNELKKIGHPRVIDYTSYEEEIETIEDFYKALLKHAKENHCLLKGNLSRQLYNESRAGTTDPNSPSWWACLDFDGVKNVTDMEAALHKLGLGDVDYIVQYSASSGVIPDRGISAHVFILLTNVVNASILKQWLISKNLTVPEYKQNLCLTRTNNALRWGLDITTCQNDKLIYIAPPICGDGVKDTFKGKRIQLVKKSLRTFTLPDEMPSAELNKTTAEIVLNELRERKGLPKRKKIEYKTEGTVEYMPKPDRATVSGIKKERGFVYLNLNGGDSWGYYHPEGNPEFIHNFKSEPSYKTAELLPEYYAQIKKEASTPKYNEEGRIVLAFRDKKSSAYWGGSYNKETRQLDINLIRSKDQVHDWLKENNQPIGDFVPTWTMAFNPHSDVIVDTDKQHINTFQPSVYMSMNHKTVKEVPPIVRKVLWNMIGEDEECLERYLNWLAVIFQHKCMTDTAWVFHGTEGTGKGMMLKRILRPVFKYVAQLNASQLDDQFNDYMEGNFIMYVDEVEVAAFHNATAVEAKLKTIIVEPKVRIRRMYMNSYETNSYINVILVGNKEQIANISPTDRRYNVAVYQPNMLRITDDELRTLDGELADFACYLATRPADKSAARTPLRNPSKEKMIHVGRAGIDHVCDAIIRGDYSFFDRLRPVGVAASVTRAQLEGAYNKLIDQAKEGKKNLLTRDDVFTLIEYTIGGMSVSPYKFESYLKHHRISFDSRKSIRVEWKVNEDSEH